MKRAFTASKLPYPHVRCWPRHLHCTGRTDSDRPACSRLRGRPQQTSASATWVQTATRASTVAISAMAYNHTADEYLVIWSNRRFSCSHFDSDRL